MHSSCGLVAGHSRSSAARVRPELDLSASVHRQAVPSTVAIPFLTRESKKKNGRGSGSCERKEKHRDTADTIICRIAAKKKKEENDH